MPKDYEMTLIVDTQLAEGSVDETVTRYEGLIGEHGTLVNVDRLGSRKLAYDIRKRQQGDYSFFQFQAEPAAISEIDRACHLDETILRYLIITVPHGFEVKQPDADATDEVGVDEAGVDGAGVVEADSDDTDDDTEEDSE
jgi:small subunit ribosomal protein S6